MVKVKLTGKTICFWCGKSHRKEKPQKCARLSYIGSKITKKLPMWKLMFILERMGIKGMEQLAEEMKIKIPPRFRKAA